MVLAAKFANITPRAIVILITFVFLGACARHSLQAPVSDRDQPPPRKMSTHTVAPGETLYSIAWRYDLDYASLARVNNIDSHFTIYPGQRLNLKVDPRKPWEPRQSAGTQASSSSPSSASGSERSKNKSNTYTERTKSSELRQTLVWQWPLQGRILTKFKAQSALQKGIDINGKLGESVLAASSGVVVYSGDGLRAYGKLLIVKHSDTYLSAYAHNRRLVVKEGDTVKAGQKIAEVGSTGTDKVKLYFEIRRDGKPVNPLLYLPSR